MILFVLLICGCSASWHLQKAISKGAKIEGDTIYKDRVVTLTVPAEDTTQEINPIIDTGAFHLVMDANDSLVLVIDDLKKDIASGNTLNKEKAMAALKKANDQIRELKSRIAQGFSKDSTYHIQPDSLTVIDIEIKDGLLKKAHYKRKEATYTKVDTIPIEIRRIFNIGYKYWQLGLAVIAFLIVGFILGRLTKGN